MAQATAQGFQLHEPELWAFLSLGDGPTRPGLRMAGPGWLTALGRARHITNRIVDRVLQGPANGVVEPSFRRHNGLVISLDVEYQVKRVLE